MLTPNVVPDFTSLRVAVVGDLIADHYLFTRPTRLSREAPVIVMRHTSEHIGAGGAANVARNVWALGPRTALHGVVGRDVHGRDLLHLLDDDGVDVQGVETLEERVTPTKTRVMGAEPGRTHQQVLRIDREPEAPLDPAARRRVAERVRGLAGTVDALLVSDYGYGLVDEELAEAAALVQAAGAVVVLDPRTTLTPFRDVTAITPNLSELAEATERPVDALEDMDQVVHAANELRARISPRWLLVTMGNRGMVLFSEEHPEGARVAASGPDSVVDVSGAGDTAAAVFTLGLASGLSGARAMRLANAAAGVVVMENGAAVCGLSTLRSALPHAPHPLGLRASLSG